MSDRGNHRRGVREQAVVKSWGINPPGARLASREEVEPLLEYSRSHSLSLSLVESVNRSLHFGCYRFGERKNSYQHVPELL